MERSSSEDLTLQRQALVDLRKIDVFKGFGKLKGEHLYQSLYLMKLRDSSLQFYCKTDLTVDVFQ